MQAWEKAHETHPRRHRFRIGRRAPGGDARRHRGLRSANDGRYRTRRRRNEAVCKNNWRPRRRSGSNRDWNEPIKRCPPEERKLYDQQMEEFGEIRQDEAGAVAHGNDASPMAMVSSADLRLGGRKLFEAWAGSDAGFPAFLGASEPEIAPPEAQPKSTGRRSALAQWLTRPDHPLTARVMVNRLWQYHFGQGIVATPNDFGAMGGQSIASGIARLARLRICRQRLAFEADPSPDGAVGHILPIVASRSQIV